VEYEFEYKANDGRRVSIKPNESYILVSKTNEHWWHVRKDQHTRPFYLPAQYVKELSASPGPNKLDSVECQTKSKPVEMTQKTSHYTTAVIRESTRDASKDRYRFSTFGFCDDMPDVKPPEPLKDVPTASSFAQTVNNAETHTSPGTFSMTSAALNTEGLQVYAKPQPAPKARNKQQRPKSSQRDDTAEQPQTFVDDKDEEFPPPPSPMCDMIPEINITEFDTFPDVPDFVAHLDESASQQQSLNQTAEAASSTDEQVIF